MNVKWNLWTFTFYTIDLKKHAVFSCFSGTLCISFIIVLTEDVNTGLIQHDFMAIITGEKSPNPAFFKLTS